MRMSGGDCAVQGLQGVYGAREADEDACLEAGFADAAGLSEEVYWAVGGAWDGRGM